MGVNVWTVVELPRTGHLARWRVEASGDSRTWPAVTVEASVHQPIGLFEGICFFGTSPLNLSLTSRWVGKRLDVSDLKFDTWEQAIQNGKNLCFGVMSKLSSRCEEWWTRVTSPGHEIWTSQLWPIPTEAPAKPRPTRTVAVGVEPRPRTQSVREWAETHAPPSAEQSRLEAEFNRLREEIGRAGGMPPINYGNQLIPHETLNRYVLDAERRAALNDGITFNFNGTQFIVRHGATGDQILQQYYSERGEVPF